MMKLTTVGKFRVRAYRVTLAGFEHIEPIVVIMGDVEGKREIPVRVHDACFTSEVLGNYIFTLDLLSHT